MKVKKLFMVGCILLIGLINLPLLNAANNRLEIVQKAKQYLFKTSEGDVVGSLRQEIVEEDLVNGKITIELTLNNAKNSYLESLEKCYDRYYYDSNNAITIIDYDISNDKYLRSVSIYMANDNYCSEDYKLSDMWIYDYENLSLYVNGDITQNAMSRVISTIHEAERVNNPTIVDDYEAEVILKVNASTESIGYTLTFQDFSENELLVIKQMNNKIQFAVYTLENVIDFLNSLERRVNS